MRQKHLESALSSCQREFPSPKVELEQYPTSPHLAALIGLTALENDDIGEGRSCLDLGSGTGMLALCCALLGSECVLAVDCDPEALQIARENAENLDLEDTIEMVLAKIKPPPKQKQAKADNKKGGRGKGRGRGGRGRGGNVKHQFAAAPVLAPSTGAGDDGLPLRSNCVDTVITNPPFGTKRNAGMDVQFLRTAVRLARRAVYSFHKTSTRDYLVKTLGQEWGLEVKVVAQMKFDIPNTYKFHQKKSVDVEVDLIRVGIPGATDDEEGGHNPEDEEEEAASNNESNSVDAASDVEG